MIHSDDITSFSKHRKHLRSHVRRVQETGRPLFVTTYGRTDAVVLSPSAYDELVARAERADRHAPTTLGESARVAAEVDRALAPLKGQIELAVVFGSIAAGVADADSDIDLLIVTDLDPKRLARPLLDVERASGRSIDLTCLTPSGFQDRIATGDSFLTEILRSPYRLVRGNPLSGETDALDRPARSSARDAARDLPRGR